MKLLFQPEPWQDDAVCRRVDPDTWFSKQQSDVRAAQKICWTCPVINECLNYSLRNREPYGVWGGIDEKQRRKLLERSGRQAASACASLWHLANGHEQPCPNCATPQAA